MNLSFPMLRSKTCTNTACQNREEVSVRKSRLLWWLNLLRLTTLAVSASLVGGAAVGLFLVPAKGQGVHPAQQTIEQFEIQEQQDRIEELKHQITAMQTVLDDQAKDIATLHGIGIGLGGFLMLLQIAQIAVGIQSKK